MADESNVSVTEQTFTTEIHVIFQQFSLHIYIRKNNYSFFTLY